MAADIDIDLPDRQKLLGLIKHIPAMMIHTGTPRVHNSGVYITEIPVNPLTGFAAITHEEADRRGYFKLDLLNMSVYSLVQNTEHYERMLLMEPAWAMLYENTDWAKQLVHVGNYTDLLRNMKPDTVQRMAAFISIIRPGKAHLQNKSWDEVFATVWDGDDSRGYTFKKSHALGYAMLVTLHMNLLLDTANQPSAQE